MAKNVLITGTTSGIGLETANALAKAGMNLIMVARDKSKLEIILKRLREENPQINIKYYLCDFSDLKQTSQIAKQISNENPDIDILINNAGTWFNKLQLNEDGIELTWVVNYFAMFIFTNILLNNLKKRAEKTGDVRIIILSSEAHKYGKIDFDSLKRFHYQKTYGDTKLADMMFGYKLSRILKDSKITVNCVHPGVIATELWRKIPRPIAWFVTKFMASPDEGAQTSIHLATLNKLEETGKYWAKSKIKNSTKLSRDTLIQDNLYEFSMAKMKDYL